MKISEVSIGMRISHPKHGTGRVTHIHEDSVSLIYGEMTVAALTKYELRQCTVVLPCDICGRIIKTLKDHAGWCSIGEW